MGAGWSGPPSSVAQLVSNQRLPACSWHHQGAHPSCPSWAPWTDHLPASAIHVILGPCQAWVECPRLVSTAKACHMMRSSNSRARSYRHSTECLTDLALSSLLQQLAGSEKALVGAPTSQPCSGWTNAYPSSIRHAVLKVVGHPAPAMGRVCHMYISDLV